jgi:hypothetical protein
MEIIDFFDFATDHSAQQTGSPFIAATRLSSGGFFQKRASGQSDVACAWLGVLFPIWNRGKRAFARVAL